MAGLSVGGLASGLDTDSLINQLLALEQRSILQIQRKIAFAAQKQQAYQDLDGRLNSLRGAVRNLNDDSLFRSTSASSSNESLVTVSASKDAAVGTHSIQVLQVATKHQMAAQGFADTSSTGIAAAAGTFKFKIGNGAERSINVNNTTTLRQFADAINNLNTDVRAEIVNDGSSTNPHRLVLTAKKEGSQGAVTITTNDTALNFATPTIEAATADDDNNPAYLGSVTSGGTFTGEGSTSYVIEVMQTGDPAIVGPAGPLVRYSTDGGVTWDDNGGAGHSVSAGVPFAMDDGVTATFTGGSNLTAGDRFRIDVASPEIQAAQDAVLRINGINVTKTSNTITDIYEGVTLTLKDADPSKTVTVGVSRQPGDVESKLMSFVGAYNGVVGYLNAQFSYNPTEDTEGTGAPPLNGDSAARQVQQRLKNFVTGRIQGLTGRERSALTEIGVTSDEKTGVLSLDAGKLQEALDADPTSVERILTRFGEGMNGAKFTFARRSAKSQPGEYEVNVTSPRTRAEVQGFAAAEVLAQDETLTIRYRADAQNPANDGTEIQVGLLTGDSAATQVTKINQAFTAASLQAEAFLDSGGILHIRSKDFGEKYRITAVSDVMDGPGTTNLGNLELDDYGTDLAGTIGGKSARVLDGNHLKGDAGFASEDVEVIIPDDTFGILGKVRVVDGLGESLPDVLDSLMDGTGILKSRTDGITRTIEDLEAQVVKNSARMDKVEERLRRQFTNLEVTLGQLQALGDYVSAQLGAVSSSKKK
ncbi:flagellar filament capping protein FliD [Myxococcota bacterium]|nr:flagellar filament capping protein FliD [Myxococcota bacterium]